MKCNKYRSDTDLSAGGTLLDEVQASLVGRKLPGLSNTERYLLLREAEELARQHGKTVRELIEQLGECPNK